MDRVEQTANRELTGKKQIQRRPKRVTYRKQEAECGWGRCVWTNRAHRKENGGRGRLAIGTQWCSDCHMARCQC
eukprot:12410378-Karenia_brevis.AAC.1